MITLTHILGFFSFWMGACIASFLNVVIWRVPRGESIVRPPSHCPKCNAEIRWYQNIPILAWLALRGKCANCRAPISPRYILIELVGGCLFLAAFLKFGQEQTFFAPVTVAHVIVMWIWISLMIVGSMIDFDHKLLPDFVTVGGMVLGLLFWLFVTLSYKDFSFDFDLRMFFPLGSSVAGLVFGFGLLWLVRYLGTKAFKREAMGMGDVFLMGAVGALFGPDGVLATLILSSVSGSVVGVGMILLDKAKLGKMVEIPFGPYICLGCLAWMFYGPELVRFYTSLFRF